MELTHIITGSLIYKLRGIDPDGDPLQFGVRSQPSSDIIKVENISPTEADIYLNHELDREVDFKYSIIFLLFFKNCRLEMNMP